MKNWASLPLRIGLGIIFLTHGLQKSFGLYGGLGIIKFSKTLAYLGFSPPIVFAYIVSFIELIGGILLILGFFTRVSAFLLIIIVAVTLVRFHIIAKVPLIGGYEYNFIILCALLSLLILGRGKFGLDGKIRPFLKRLKPLLIGEGT